MRERWRVVPTIQFLLFTVLGGALGWYEIQFARGFVPGLDHANQVIHKAGHLICELAYPPWTPYAGVICQLLVPALALIGFWKDSQTLLCATCGIWFSENLLDVAAYITDAGQNTLPMIGGKHYEWEQILQRWDATNLQTQIAGWVALAGWLGFAVTWWWLFRRWRRSR